MVVLGSDLAFSQNNLDRTPIGYYLEAPFDRLWLSWYILGGLLVLAAYVRNDARIEAAGLCVLAGALVADALALGLERGFAGWRSQAFYATLYVAYAWRLALLLYLSRGEHKWPTRTS